MSLPNSVNGVNGVEGSFAKSPPSRTGVAGTVLDSSGVCGIDGVEGSRELLDLLAGVEKMSLPARDLREGVSGALSATGSTTLLPDMSSSSFIVHLNVVSQFWRGYLMRRWNCASTNDDDEVGVLQN